VAATISGAGPTVIAVGPAAQLAAASDVPADGFAVRRMRPAGGVALTELS
jgi:homoserine kinase